MTTTATKCRPMTLRAHEVRAILDGRQTLIVRPITSSNSTVNGYAGRRAWAHLHFEHDDGNLRTWVDEMGGAQYLHVPAWPPGDNRHFAASYRVRPVWSVGDRLWVREEWCCYATPFVRYRADGHNDSGWTWSSASRMPRWASRLTLEITEIRCQQVQEISAKDARAEGIRIERGLLGEEVFWDYIDDESRSPSMFNAVDSFYTLWDSINGKKPGCSWADNPWVWAITFRRVER